MQASRGYNVLAPGPVNLHPQVEAALSLPMIHHRTPEFDQILARVLKGLPEIFETEQACYILSGTGSGGMEALLVNTLAPGDHILGIDSGKFGERWCEMAEVYRGALTRIKVPWGQAVSVEEVRQTLQAHPKISIVMTQACETSTGVLHPIQALGQMIRSEFPHVLFLVDGITALGAVPLPMDAWGIDGLVGGSQKAFMLPTGLTFVALSARAWKKCESNPQPRFYFDLRKEREANKKGETFFSSNVTLIRALDVVLELLRQKGFKAHQQEIHERARFTRHFGQQLGLALYAQVPSDSLTALVTPPGMDSQKLRLELEKSHGITVMGGQDQAKGKILRIGHMGYILPQQMIDLMLALHQGLGVFSRISDVAAFEAEMKRFWDA